MEYLIFNEIEYGIFYGTYKKISTICNKNYLTL